MVKNGKFFYPITNESSRIPAYCHLINIAGSQLNSSVFLVNFSGNDFPCGPMRVALPFQKMCSMWSSFCSCFANIRGTEFSIFRPATVDLQNRTALIHSGASLYPFCLSTHLPSPKLNTISQKLID